MKKVLLILFIIIITGFSYSIFIINKETKKSQLQQVTDTYVRTYKTIYDEKKQLAETILSEISSMSQLNTRLAKLPTATKKQYDNIRNDIYKDLKSRYKQLNSLGIRQLHIHLPNNTTFLRMHRPDKYGDDLSKIRPSVVHVNKYKKPIDTMEEGKFYYGLRFVFPIKDKRVYLGSIEISFGASAITSAVMEHNYVLSNFFIKKANADEKNVKDNNSLYLESHHKGYYYDKEVLEVLEKVSRKDMKDLKPIKKTTDIIRLAGQKDQPSSYHDESIDSIFTIIPIINKLTNKNIAFLTVRSQSKNIILSDKYTNIIIFLSISLLAIGFYLLYVLLNKKQELEIIVEHRTKELNIQKEMLIEAQRIAHIGHWEWNIVKNTLHWSDEIYRIFGLPPQSFIANYEEFLNRVHPNDREYVTDSVNKALSHEKDYDIEHRLILPDNSEKVVHERAIVQFDEQGKPLKMLGTTHDISKQKQIENSLRNSNEKFRALTETTQDFVWEVAIDGIYTYCSPQSKEILGYEPEEMLGKSPFDFMPPDEAKRQKTIFKAILTQCEPIKQLENINLAKNGQKVILETSGQAFFNNAGEIQGYRGIDRDITQRKQAEVELKYIATHDALTGLYNRRTLDELLNNDINRAIRYKHSVSLFMLDIDCFKQINDTYGHQSGDIALRKFASIIEESIRKTDYAARYGGEEFIVVLLETSLSEAEELAQRLLHTIDEFSFFTEDNKKLNITASIGVATFPEYAQSGQDLIHVADNAMYAAKKSGRNQVKTS